MADGGGARLLMPRPRRHDCDQKPAGRSAVRWLSSRRERAHSRAQSGLGGGIRQSSVGGREEAARWDARREPVAERQLLDHRQHVLNNRRVVEALDDEVGWLHRLSQQERTGQRQKVEDARVKAWAAKAKLHHSVWCTRAGPQAPWRRHSCRSLPLRRTFSLTTVSSTVARAPSGPMRITACAGPPTRSMNPPSSSAITSSTSSSSSTCSATTARATYFWSVQRILGSARSLWRRRPPRRLTAKCWLGAACGPWAPWTHHSEKG